MGYGRVLCCLAALLLIGCSRPQHAGNPPGQGAPPPVTKPPPTAPPAGVENGGECQMAKDCRSGICEGQGCGDVLGVCMSRARVCSTDARQYCGCDGQTFTESGSCPGRRFKARGACTPSKATKAADRAACAEASDCASGICEGLGCGETKGVCVARSRMCTRDLRQYCGCDRKTFSGSGSCPNRRYRSRGPCRN